MQTRVHLHLPVRSLEAALAFYTRLFGAAPSKQKPGYANFRLDSPALHLALTESPGAPAVGPHHFGVELFSLADLAGQRARVEAAGLSLRVEHEVTCCHAVGEKFWARDPDGNEWEFWVRLADTDTAGKPAAADCCATGTASPQACCAVPETACCA